MIAYIVTGSTGEYSDQQSWNTRVFLSEEAANNFCKKLNDWVKENGLHSHSGYIEYRNRDIKCPHDSRFSCDYTGTSYFVDTAEFGE